MALRAGRCLDKQGFLFPKGFAPMVPPFFLQGHKVAASCLKVKVVGCQNSAFCAVVKNGSALKVLGQVQHIAYASRQALRHMGLAYDGQVLWKDGEGIHQDVVVAAKGPNELFGRALFGTQKAGPPGNAWGIGGGGRGDRKSTRLNSSHVRISYAVFCLKK